MENKYNGRKVKTCNGVGTVVGVNKTKSGAVTYLVEFKTKGVISGLETVSKEDWCEDAIRVALI